MKNVIRHSLVILLISSIILTHELEDDFDLDLIDINQPKEKKKLIESLFPTPESTIGLKKTLEVLYKFLNNISIENLHVVEQKHLKKPKSLTVEEQDILSSANVVHVYLDHMLGEGHSNGAITKQQLETLMNKEKYHEHAHRYADKLIEGMQDMLDKDLMQEDYYNNDDL